MDLTQLMEGSKAARHCSLNVCLHLRIVINIDAVIADERLERHWIDWNTINPRILLCSNCITGICNFVNVFKADKDSSKTTMSMPLWFVLWSYYASLITLFSLVLSILSLTQEYLNSAPV